MSIAGRDRFLSFLFLWIALGTAANSLAEVKIIVPAGYLTGVPFLTRVEVRDNSGARNWNLWDAEAILSVDQAGVSLSTNRIALRNGLGTALLLISGSADFTLTATVNGERAERAIQNLSGQPRTTFTGTLPGSSTTWSGVVNVTGNLTVPSGHTLTLQPNTIVLIDGVSAGTSGISIRVNGAIQSLGTELHPVTITGSKPDLNWGQIRHDNAQPSLYQHTFISKAGRAPGEGHTGTGPAVRPSNSTVTFESCVISDLTAGGATIGKIMMASGSTLVFRDCVLARARMGPEIAGTALICTNSYLMEMKGPDDADGIYLHSAGGRALTLSGCVLAHGDDDAIDTLDSNVTVENCLLRDWANPSEDAKGVSVFNGEVHLRHCLIVNCFAGVAAKSGGPLAVVRIDHCTIVSLDKGVTAATKSNASAGNIQFYMTNSIVRSTDAVHSDFGPDKFVSVTYCNLSEAWSGAGNIATDPLFVNSPASDYHLQPGSPCIDAGDPAFPLDSDGSRTEMGFYRAQTSRVLSTNQLGVVINEIMYHPASENPLEEYLELFNGGTSPVDLEGWRLRDAVKFIFPKVSIPAGGYLVVAADLTTFRSKYPGVDNVVGNWTGLLGNNREEIDLEDAQGSRVDSVHYADEGDWAIRRRGRLDRNHRGWEWFADHDGLGKSLELINPNLSNNSGQNWAASLVPQGTPGRANSVVRTETAPLIQDVVHLPIVPRSNEPIRVTAQVIDEATEGLTVRLSYRVDAAAPPPFTTIAMRDDGQNSDASAGDRIFSVALPGQANNAVIEFYVTASDTLGNARTWPAPAITAPDGAGPAGQVVNALLQVDDTVYTGRQPLYKIIMTENERAELQVIPSQSDSEGPNSQMNATFIRSDGAGTESHYLVGVRNRGHGSRRTNPPNYHVAFRRDDRWKGLTELNLNAVQIYLQHFGSLLANKSGAVGTYSHAAQVRINNLNRATAGGGMFGSYAANEVYGPEWAERHIPFDSEGNLYRVVRDIRPPNFNYRGPNKASYVNTYFKETNASEDDWTDLIGMLQIMGENSGELFTIENIRKVINVEQWLTHFAVMSLFANGESGLNTGNNDDYFMYRGVADPRFILLFHDLDQILGVGSLAANTDIFRATCCPISGDSEGAWRAMNRFLHHPEIEPLYYATLQRLLDTTFSKRQFDALIDQVLGSYIPQGTINSVKSWMDQRRTFVRSRLPAGLPGQAPRANITGVPRSPAPGTTASLAVGGTGVTHYRFSLNGGAFGTEVPVDTRISLSGLSNGTNIVAVIGRNASGGYQAAAEATVVSWIVNTSWPGVQLNEILASRSAPLPDQLELYNESAAPLNLGGMRLTDDPAEPNKFIFGSVTLAPGAYLVLDSNQLGFSLSGTGEAVYLLDNAANGGAVLDSVEFGLQLPDFSIGRLNGAGDWHLTQPSFGEANRFQPLGDLALVKINEWLAFGVSPYPDDFVELYNPQPLPAPLGGSFFTDQPFGAPTRSRIAPLSFVPAMGHALFTAGNGNRSTEINFNLAAEQGEIALVAPDLSLIDSVLYGPQRIGISTGRCPDGALVSKALETPTPGGPNQCAVVPPPPQSVTLMPFNQVWKYNASGADLGAAWKETNYDDSAWSAGPGLLGFETAALPEPLRTTFTGGTNKITFYFRTLFRFDPSLSSSTIQITHLIDDGAAFYLNGQEIGLRYNLPAGANYQTFASSTAEASTQGFTIPASQLRAGTNLFAVEVHQVNRTSSDIVFGLKLEALVATNSVAQAGILINEVLAHNATLQEPDGSKPDWIELYNPSGNTVDVAGMSLTDDVASPRRWIFPSGSVIPAKGLLKVRCNPSGTSSETDTGFGLRANGGAIYLLNRPAEGGGVQSSVTYGLQAADWSVGRVPDGGTNWFLNLPTLGAPNVAASLGALPLIKLNEWMANPASGEDWFEIFNPNPQPVDLSRLWLSDNLSEPMKHPLPPLSFVGIGSYAFQKFEVDERLEAGADHVNFKLSASGEALAISTPDGKLIDGITFGSQAIGVAQGRLPDGSPKVVNFTASATPGTSNFLPLNNVVVNELLSHSDPPFEDAVELYNASVSAIDMGGWFVSDSAFHLRKYQIPSKTILPPGGYLVLYENQFNNGATASEPFSFSSAQGDEVYLSEAVDGVLTGYRAHATFGPAENGVSYGRFPTSQGSHFVPMAQRTFGKDTPATANDFRLGAGAANAYAKVGPVVISEIMYHPALTNDVLEFVELHNISAAAVPLYDPNNPANTWRLRKGVDFDFPPSTGLPAGSYLVLVSFNPQLDTAALATFRNAYGSSASLAGPYRGKLKDSGDAIELQKPDLPQTIPGPDFGLVPYLLVDCVEYGDAAPWPVTADGAGHSLHKKAHSLYGNDPVNWTGAAPDPGTGPAALGDSDRDGLPNEWELANGLNPNDPADAAADLDEDGMSNSQEYLAGTNPRNAASVFTIHIRRNFSGLLMLEFTAAANKSYTIEYSDSLASGIWEKLSQINAGPSDRGFQLPITAGGSSRFFRIVISP